MKIILVPNTANPYDVAQLRSLATALKLKSCDTFVFDCPVKQHHNVFLPTHFETAGYSERDIYKKVGCDVLIEVNRFRSNYLPRKTRHISWFQDVRPSDYKKIEAYTSGMHPDDRFYLLGDKKHFGFCNEIQRVQCLLTGVLSTDISLDHKLNENYDYDINLLGYLSLYKERPPLGIAKNRLNILLREIIRKPRFLKNLILGFSSKDVFFDRFFFDKKFIENELRIKNQYIPLSGHLFEPELNNSKNSLDTALYDYQYIELPRKLDRKLLYNMLETLYKKNKKVLIAGINWLEEYPYAPFVSGHVVQPNKVYKSSKITIHNNTHGLGIHSRVLDCMAVGGFVMMHPSPHSRLPGGMDSTFEPDVNYGLYTSDKFGEKVEDWLADEHRRKNAIIENKKILLSKHLWEHRAEQILRDLK